MEQEKKSSNWGGRREGAGRKKKGEIIIDGLCGLERKPRSIYCNAYEYDILRAFLRTWREKNELHNKYGADCIKNAEYIELNNRLDFGNLIKYVNDQYDKAAQEREEKEKEKEKALRN